MILLDCVNRVKRLSHRGNQAVTTDQITQDIVDCMNDARREIIQKLPKHWLITLCQTPITTVQGTTDYSLEQPLQEPLEFHFTFNNVLYVLKKVDSIREFDQTLFTPNVSQQYPRFYVELGPDSSGNRQIKVFPTPDQAYTIFYYYFKDPTQTDFTVSNLSIQVPDIPIYLHDILWKGALYYFLAQYDDLAMTQKAEKDYQEAFLQIEISENQEMDNELAFRYGNKTMWYDPTTRFKQF